MDEQFWKNYYILREHKPSLAREYLHIARTRERLIKQDQKWRLRLTAFLEEIEVEKLKLGVDMWNEKGEDGE